MYSVPAFLGTPPRYLLGQDNQPSTTSHRQKLQCKTHSHAQYATKWIPTQTIWSSTVRCHKNFQLKEPACPQCKEAKLPRQGNPTFLGKLSRQVPVYDTPPSSIRYRRKLPGYGTQPSPASYPKLRHQATQPSSTHHQYQQRIDRHP